MDVTKQLGVEIGGRGEPHRPVKEALAQRGVRISGPTIHRIRSGKVRPTQTAFRLACADKLLANDASLKTHYHLHLLEIALRNRRPARSSRGIYACKGLSAALRAALACSQRNLAALVCAMRADLALWSTVNRDERIARQFREAASLFVRVHHDRDWRAIRGVNDLIRIGWDQHTIHGFYFSLCSVAGSVTRAAWFPYELDVLRSFYERQQQLGDPLTPLDRQVLSSLINLTPTASELAMTVRAHIGVALDPHSVAVHRNLLVLGRLDQRGRGPLP